MKTLTEFFGPKLITAQEKMPAWKDEATKAATEALTAEGKTPEDIAAALPGAVPVKLLEKLATEEKLEGDKGKWFLKALELAEGNRGRIKRIVVSQLAEAEKAPAGSVTVEDKVFTVEFFPEPARAMKPGKERFDGKGRGKGRGDRKGGRGKGGRDNRGGGKPRDPIGRNPDGGAGGERKFSPRGDRPQPPKNDLKIETKPRVIPLPRPGIIKPLIKPRAEAIATATPVSSETTPSTES